MLTTTTLIIITFVLVGTVFLVREQYTTYPGVNQRRLNTIKQLSDDVLRDLNKMSPQTRPSTAVAPTYVPTITTRPAYVRPQSSGSPPNIPAWVRTLTSSAASQQLMVLNPGYTVRRIPVGGVISREYSPMRITLTYDTSDRIVSISQG
jgi:hypothetical protein